MLIAREGFAHFLRISLTKSNFLIMKKIFLFCASLALVGTMNAQLTSKKGENYLPEAGDYAIGADASSMLSYFGNMLNGGSNTGFGMGFTNGATAITGKKFMTDKMAYRGMVRVGFGSDKVTTPNGSNEDVVTNSYNNITLGAGIENRRGNTRLQGYYGAMAMVSLGGSKTSYEYGAGVVDGQITEAKAGSTFGLGVRAFVGAEYFVLPKISIGGEFGWGLGFTSTGASSTTTQGPIGTVEGGKSSHFGIDTDNKAFGVAPAAVLVHFHF
jgi:hypothetical protein